MALYAVDPGTEQSAIVVVDGVGTIRGAIYRNDSLLCELGSWDMGQGHLVIEEVESYGMPVGREVFQTVFWGGRFAQKWEGRSRLCSWSLLPRKTVKLTLCGSPRAKDANIRQALIDRYGGPSCIKKGGPLAGIKSHLWAALALAVTYQELQKQSGSKEGR